MRWLALGGLALALALVVAWALPAATGPSSVDCGELEPATCQQVWRRAADEHDAGILRLLPVTRVEVSEMTEENLCGGVFVERWIFGTALNDYCH